MENPKRRYSGHRFPPDTISQAVWLCHRFTLNFRDIEDLLAERGVTVFYESIHCWCLKFGPGFRRSLKRREGRLGDRWYADEVFIRIYDEIHYLWRAVDQDGNVLDILVQRRRDARAAKRFFRKILKAQGKSPNWLISDKLGRYRVAVREILPGTQHDTSKYANNRAEISHQPTRQQERQMRRFKSRHQAQRFLALHAQVGNLFRYGRHMLRAAHHRLFRARALAVWAQVTCA